MSLLSCFIKQVSETSTDSQNWNSTFSFINAVIIDVTQLS